MNDLGVPILVPKKLISTWSGLLADIPEGWVLCDGNNGTPNLIAKFVRGAPVGDDSGATGGEDTHILNQAELASHSHSFSESTHNHSVNNLTGTAVLNNGFRKDTRDDISSITIGNATSGITIDASGGGGSHENKPPFFELAYIMNIV